MRWLFGVLLFINAAWSAAIDAKLYEGNDREPYYREIQTLIESAQHDEHQPREIVQEEKLQLSRLRAAASQPVRIERYDLTPLSAGPVDPERLYSALEAAALLHLKEQQQRKVLRDIQSKLTFLKQRIERITEEEKPRLLSYQLQFAYYKIQQNNIETKTALLKSHAEEIQKALSAALPSLKCDTMPTIGKRLAQSEETIGQALKRKIALQLDHETAMIESSGEIEQILRKIEAADAQYQQALVEKTVLQIKQSMCLLQEKRSKELFNTLNAIEKHVADITKEVRSLYREEIAILKEISKATLGTTDLYLGDTLQESKNMLLTVKEYLTSPFFVFNEQPISVLSLFKALILIILGLILGMFYKRWIARISRRWPDMSQMSVRLASNIGYYLIVIIALFNAISSIGINMTSISLIAGALSIGVGFGLQTVVSNFIAGIILMFERTIRIGDTIEISDMLRGRVTDMRIRSTTIKTFDNIDIVVPNSSFIQNNVINWTLEDLTRRLHIPFSVAYGTEVDKVKRVILDELALSNLTYIKDESEKHPEVWMVAMNSSSVDFELLVWIEWASKLRPNSLRSDFLILIYKALYKHEIQIPFPQLDLYVKQMPGCSSE